VQEVFYTGFTKQSGQEREVVGNDEGDILAI